MRCHYSLSILDAALHPFFVVFLSSHFCSPFFFLKREHALAIVDAINHITHDVETLVSSFEALASTAGAQEKLKFGEAAKQIGNSIDQLVFQTDRAPEVKMKVKGVDAIANCEALVAAAKGNSQQALIEAARSHAVSTGEAVKSTTEVSGDVRDPGRQRILAELAQRIKSEGPGVIQHAQAIFGNPNANRAGLDAAANAYITSIRRAQEAAKQPRRDGTGFGKIDSSVDFMTKLINMARVMNEAADRLYEASQSGDKDAFISAARNAGETAIKLHKVADEVAEKHPDALLGQLIRDVANDIKGEASGLIRAAKKANDSHDPSAMHDLSASHKGLTKAVRDLVYLVSGEKNANQSLADKLYGQDTRTIEALAKKVVETSKAGDKPNLDKNATGLSGAGRRYLDDARALADATSDARQRDHISQTADEVYRLTNELSDAGRALVPTPGDSSRRNRVDDVYDRLIDSLNRMKAGAPPEVVAIAVASAEPEARDASSINFDLDLGNSTDELVRAARAQAEAAQALARDASKIASAMKDANKRAELERAIRDMLDNAQALIRAAEIAAADPKNKSKYDALSAAQQALGDSMSRVMGLTGAADNELQAMLAQLQEQQAREAKLMQDFFDEADDLIAACENYVNHPPSDVAGNVNAVKDITNRGNTCNTKMRAFANGTSSPDFKAQLLAAAGYIKDRSLQLKIIGMVKAAANDESARKNQLYPAVRGLRDEAKDIVKTAQGQVLKYRIAIAHRQLELMKRAVDEWRAQHALFRD
jgi:hypothetical protein